jgi:hypothetical protein
MGNNTHLFYEDIINTIHSNFEMSGDLMTGNFDPVIEYYFSDVFSTSI